MILFFLCFWARVSLPYPTTITSNYTQPPPPVPPLFPQRTVPVLQARLLVIFDPQNPAGFLEYQRNISTTYSKAFPVSPQILIGIEGIVDTQVKTGVNLQLEPATTPTVLSITYSDFGSPFAWSIGKLLKIRFLAFDPTSLPNTQLLRQEFTVYDTVYSVSKSIPAPWVGLNVHIIPFLTKMQFSVPSTGQYSIFTSVSSSLPSTSSMTLQIKALFVTPFNVSKTIGINFFLYLQHSDWSITIGDLSLLNPQTSLPTANGLYYFIGLSQYSIPYTHSFQSSFNQDSTILHPPAGAPTTYQIKYCFFVLNDTQYYFPEYIPPLPDPRPESYYSFELTTIVSFSHINTSFLLVYENIPLPDPISKSQVALNISSIRVQQAYMANNSLIILCAFDEELDLKNLEVVLTWMTGGVEYKATTTMVLQASPPLKVYSILKKGVILGNICSVIQYFYLTAFVIALFSHKLLGVELITFIQLIFYGQIPLDLEDKMFSGLKSMSRASGFNLPLLDTLHNIPIPQYYSSLNLHYNFLSNLNLMLIPILVCPMAWGLLLFCSRHSKSYKYKPRLKRVALSFLLQIPLALTLLNVYNINISFVINLSNLGQSSTGILVFGGVCVFLPIALGVMYIIFSQKYTEFREQLKTKVQLPCLSEQSGQKLVKCYPIILSLEIILTPFLLSSSKSFHYCYYIILVLNLLVTVYVFVATPYREKLDTCRLFIHRVLMLIALINFIIIQNKVSLETELDSSFYQLAWAFVGLLCLDWILNFPFIIWEIAKAIQKPGIVDVKLMVQHKGRIEKPNNQVQDEVDPVYYPILEYGRGRERRERERKQRQRQKRGEVEEAAVQNDQ